MARTRKSTRSNSIYSLYTFVLWGPRFDEIMAVTLTTKFRTMGLRVKIVSLAGQYTMGRNGLAIGADMFLDKALSLMDQALCVVVPCSVEMLHYLEETESIVTFFEKAHSKNITIVIGEAEREALSTFKLLQPCLNQVIICPQGEELAEFSHQLAMHLLNSSESRNDPDSPTEKFIFR